jgi:hypothetical protein
MPKFTIPKSQLKPKYYKGNRERKSNGKLPSTWVERKQDDKNKKRKKNYA